MIHTKVNIDLQTNLDFQTSIVVSPWNVHKQEYDNFINNHLLEKRAEIVSDVLTKIDFMRQSNINSIEVKLPS